MRKRGRVRKRNSVRNVGKVSKRGMVRNEGRVRKRARDASTTEQGIGG